MKRLLNFLMLCLLCAGIGKAGPYFVAKPQEGFHNNPISSDRYQNLLFRDLFEYPDDLNTETDLQSVEGLEITTEATDPDLMRIEVSYYQWQKCSQAQVVVLKNAKGTGEARITVTYKGQSATAIYPVECADLIARDDFAHISLTEPSEISVVDNDLLTNWRDRPLVEISILRQPEKGTAEVKHEEGQNAVVVYTPESGLDDWSSDSFAYEAEFDGCTASANVTLSIHTDPGVARVIDFLPAPGQFTNTNWSPTIDQLNPSDHAVSLGTFGGYIVYGFHQPIKNNPLNPYGVDFQIKGNSFVAAVKGVWTEPGAVMVMKDENKNGLPDDTWYELAGSDYWLDSSHRNIEMTYINPKYNKRYTVPWHTTDGMAGAVLTNQFHQQSYFPDEHAYANAKRDSITYSGTLIMSSLDKRAPSYIEFTRCPIFGYADNKGYDKNDLTVGHDPYNEMYDCFDISWAVDKDGNYVDLDEIDFVKVYSAGAVNAGWLGEWSTEVLGMSAVAPNPELANKEIYLNYIGLNQIQCVNGHSLKYQGLFFKNGRILRDGVEAQWSVADPEIGTIDGDGTFHARSLGNTTIYLSSNLEAPVDSVDVEVVELGDIVIDIEGNASNVSNEEIACVQGESIYINVESTTTGEESTNGTKANRFIYDNYSWDNSDPEIGAIDNGLFHALQPGSTTLTVKSGIDPSLSKAIKVFVLEVPGNEITANPFKIPYDKPEGTKTNDAIFNNGRGATVFMDEVSSEAEGVFSLDKNVLAYSFPEGEYGLYKASVKAEYFGEDHAYDINFKYGADQQPTPEMVLGAKGRDILGYVVEADTIATVATLGSNVQSIYPDGIFAIAVTDNSVTRISLDDGSAVASAPLGKGAHLSLVVDDKIFVVDSLKLKSFYRTDLEKCRVAELAAEPQSLSHSQGRIYLGSASADSTAYVAIDSYNGYAAADKLPTLPYGFAGEVYPISESEIFGFISTANGVQAVNLAEADNVDADAIPYSFADANNVYVADGNGFRVFSKSQREFAADNAMAGASKPVFGYVADNRKCYVLYANHKVRSFDIIDGLPAAEGAEAAAFSAAVAPAIAYHAATSLNMEPEFDATRKPSSGSIYEAGRYTSYVSVSGSYGSDNEGAVKCYARIPEGYDQWMALENGRIKALCQGFIDRDTVINLTYEIIDAHGASAKKEYTALTIKAINAAPAINGEAAFVVDNSSDFVAKFPLTSLFADKNQAANKSFAIAKDKTHGSHSVMLYIEGDSLVAEGLAGDRLEGIVTIEYNLKSPQYNEEHSGGKFFYADLPLLVAYPVKFDFEPVAVTPSNDETLPSLEEIRLTFDEAPVLNPDIAMPAICTADGTPVAGIEISAMSDGYDLVLTLSKPIDIAGEFTLVIPQGAVGNEAYSVEHLEGRACPLMQRTYKLDGIDGIDHIGIDTDGDTEWYGLNGMRIRGGIKAPGYYLRRHNGVIEKILVK